MYVHSLPVLCIFHIFSFDFFFSMFTLKTVIYHLFSHSLILCNFFFVTLQKNKKKKIVGGYFSLTRLHTIPSVTHSLSMTLCNIIYESVVEGRKKCGVWVGLVAENELRLMYEKSALFSWILWDKTLINVIFINLSWILILLIRNFEKFCNKNQESSAIGSWFQNRRK